EIRFYADFRHESGSPIYRVHGFWDGDGQGGIAGGVFKIRFCPTKPGKWKLAEVVSNTSELDEQRECDYVRAVESGLHGFWLPDDHSPGNRWCTRYDLMKKEKTVLTETAEGAFEFDSPDTRAVLFHFKNTSN
ncbi:MAG: DUF5060 domain-containing protein, partial [Verrucomicrobia bacterium]|nr:DUF5060 domain-containing protein [Verrucomicrobiota bacterium]